MGKTLGRARPGRARDTRNTLVTQGMTVGCLRAHLEPTHKRCQGTGARRQAALRASLSDADQLPVHASENKTINYVYVHVQVHICHYAMHDGLLVGQRHSVQAMSSYKYG